MKEDFLHYVWNFKLFNTSGLKTTNQENIQIIKAGQHNKDAGPDFFNSQIKLDDTLWAGNVEIHIKSSDWDKHKHQNDQAYDNVILHVVYEDDKQVVNSKAQLIPTVELKNSILENVVDNYQKITFSKDWIACANQLKNVDQFTINNWLERLAYERLERKSEEIKLVLEQNHNDWESTFYQFLMKYFGLKVNALPFELVAKNTPLKILEKHSTINSIEALLFGQAGFLNEDGSDEYYIGLKKEYAFLKNKFRLTTLDRSVWKLLRLRPYNFPTIRLSQMAQLLQNNSRMFNAFINAKKIDEVKNQLAAKASIYWDDHYSFGEPSKQKIEKKVGIQTIDSIAINVVVPLLFVYAKSINDDELIIKSLKWLQELNSEKNSVITKWGDLGIKSESALESQALLELKNNYCSEKKCLNCNIGNKLLKQRT